jgi:signal transduction histidine kinase/DNA-binding response OmpR family regulator
MTNLRKIVLILITCLVDLATMAQTNEAVVDSIFQKYRQQNGSSQIATANELIKLLHQEEHIDTLLHFSTSNISSMPFHVYSGMAAYYSDINQYGKAADCGKQALKNYVSSIDNESYATFLFNLSAIYQRMGNPYEAIKYQEMCYKLDLSSGNKEDISSSLNNLATLYLSAKQPAEALDFANKAIALERELGRKDRLAIRLGVASEIYLQLHQPEKALELAQEAYEIDHSEGRADKAAIRQTMMANTFIELHRYDEARKAMDEALPVLEAAKNTNSTVICHNQMGRLLLLQGKKDQAAYHFEQALAKVQSLGNRYLERTARYGLYESLRESDPQRALQQLETYSILSDSIYHSETAQLLSQFHSRYHADELKEKNNDLSQQNEMQRRLNIAAIVAILALVVLLSILFYALRMRTKANMMMKKVEEMRQDFFTKITHEFRTPLTVIMGMSDNIAEGRTTDENDIRKAGRIILRNGYHMQKLTNQLLNISRLRSNHVKPEWQHGDLVPYTAMIVETFYELAHQNQLNLEYSHKENPLMADFVPDLYHTMLYNLLSNAVKFTPSGGTITLSLSENNGFAMIDVKDTGVGIAEKDIPHVFEEFYTSEKESSSIGTGVGLALVKQIVTVVEGTIWVTSKEGEGTTFHIKLPLKHGTQQWPSFSGEEKMEKAYTPFKEDEKDQEDALSTDQRERVLIIEDNDDVMGYLRSLLHSDYALFMASNGNEGLEKARNIIPDIIVTDLMMPGIDGLQLCQQVKNDPLLSHIPVIVVTARNEDNDRILGLKAGADAYLVKPFIANELLVRVEQLLLSRRQLRERFSQAIQEHEEEPKEQLNAIDQQLLDKLNDTVMKGLEEGSVDVETIASAMCMSSKQLRRKLFAITGETTASYIMHLRLNHAKHLLDHSPGLNIGDIALRCGFEDNAHFARAFKQYFGLTPTQYRKKASP